MTSIVANAAAAMQSASRLLHGETITLHDRDGVSDTEIADAVVSVSQPQVTIDGGKAEYNGVLRLAAEHRPAALTCNTVTARGQTWHILSVGDVYADSFRVEITREDQVHTNIFDLNDVQTEWGE